MVEYPDLQGKNILEIEPKYYNNLNIDGFSKMMKSPSYCYKFYWLEAIIQLISEGKTESTFDEIIDEMITNAWYSVREFHIHLSGMPLDGQIKCQCIRRTNFRILRDERLHRTRRAYGGDCTGSQKQCI